MNKKDYKECNRCVMNTDVDEKLIINSEGLCNHCLRYDKIINERVLKGNAGRDALNKIVNKIKIDGKNKPYDCLIGVSGGVDSTYVAYLVKSLGLRPLAVHFDNGWNSELAVANIEKTLNNLKIDLITHVVNWNEFRDLQISFLKASVPDGEVPTDHGINALLWRQAACHKIKYIISGMNFTTESTNVLNWSYGHSDWKYIKSVHKQFSKVLLKTYPHFSFLYLFYAFFIKRIRIISILNYMDYNVDAAKKLLKDKLGWIEYGGKHHESIYTRFYQGVILHKKFSIDKRYSHLSDLINSGQMTKIQAKKILSEPTYDYNLQEEDKAYVLKKLGLSETQYVEIMNLPRRNFRDYPNSYIFVQFLKQTINFLRKYGLYPR